VSPAGTAIGGIDGLIAATVKVHQLQVVTRNVAHFRHAGVDVISPWYKTTTERSR
jgi:predicted nucleic acid-binding protein